MSNYKTVLHFMECVKHPYKILSNEDYINTYNEVGIECKHNHINIFTVKTLISRIKDPFKELCKDCEQQILMNNRIKEYCQILKEKSPHKILEIKNASTVHYICYMCGKKNIGKVISLSSGNKFCNNCKHLKLKRNYEELKSEVESYGMKLLTEKTDYKNNQHPLHIICVCGNEHKMVIGNIRRGNRCEKCTIQKTKKTCMEKYGCAYAFDKNKVQIKNE
jgi:hypothetical protein